jgi:hypothetical protein
MSIQQTARTRGNANTAQVGLTDPRSGVEMYKEPVVGDPLAEITSVRGTKAAAEFIAKCVGGEAVAGKFGLDMIAHYLTQMKIEAAGHEPYQAGTADLTELSAAEFDALPTTDRAVLCAAGKAPNRGNNTLFRHRAAEREREAAARRVELSAAEPLSAEEQMARRIHGADAPRRTPSMRIRR